MRVSKVAVFQASIAVVAVSIPLGLALSQDIDLSQIPPGTDVFSTMTEGSDPSNDVFNIGPGDQGDPGPSSWGWLIPGPGVTGDSGPQPGPGSNLPPVLRVPLLRRPTNSGPCGGHLLTLTPRMYFEAQVQHMQCAADGVSPGVHRVCADLAQTQGRIACLDWRDGAPKIPASIRRLVMTCESGVDPATHRQDPRCEQLVHLEVCNDLIRLQAEINQSPALLTTLTDPRNRQVTSPNWPRSIYAVNLSTRLKACTASGFTPEKPACDPTSKAWPPLAALDDFLNRAAPHYNLTTSGEGLRVATDMVANNFISLGYGWLVKNAGYALLATVGKLGLRAGVPPAPVWSWSPGPVLGAVSKFNMIPSVTRPAGLIVPAFLRNTPRPLYAQERANSCGLACVKMVVQTISRKTLPESWYRTLARGAFGPWDTCAYNPLAGVGLDRIAQVLRRANVNAIIPTTRQTLDQLANATKDGYPAIVAVGKKGGHGIIVDAVVSDSSGNRYILARDPTNLDLMSEATKEEFLGSGFQPYGIYTEADFLGEGGWTGSALYTAP